jgi:hypothetical protein
MSNNSEFLWYIPNDVKAGHRGDSAVENHNSLDTLTSHARALEEHGWKGALIGTGWGRPDTPPGRPPSNRSLRSVQAIGDRRISLPRRRHWTI